MVFALQEEKVRLLASLTNSLNPGSYLAWRRNTDSE